MVSGWILRPALAGLLSYIMTTDKPRFRDSGPIRVGIGMIAIVFLLIAIATVVVFGLGRDFAAGASGVWLFLLLVLGVCFVVVGIGQTIVRRKKLRRRD